MEGGWGVDHLATSWTTEPVGSDEVPPSLATQLVGLRSAASQPTRYGAIAGGQAANGLGHLDLTWDGPAV